MQRFARPGSLRFPPSALRGGEPLHYEGPETAPRTISAGEGRPGRACVQAVVAASRLAVGWVGAAFIGT